MNAKERAALHNAIANTAFDWLASHGTAVSKEASDEQIALHIGRLDQIDEKILQLLKRARSTEELTYCVLKSSTRRTTWPSISCPSPR